jgi:hypothetical protein
MNIQAALSACKDDMFQTFDGSRICNLFIRMFSLSYTPEHRSIKVEALLHLSRYSRMRMCVSGLIRT